VGIVFPWSNYACRHLVITKGGKMTINPIDRQIGSRLKLRRNYLGITQGNLGSMIGVTFQQVQKYEKGINKISISKLQELSKILKIPMDYFISNDGNVVELFRDKEAITNDQENGSNYFDRDNRNSIPDKEVVNLIKCFQKIKSKKIRSAILNLIDLLNLKDDDKKK
jgi:transcriptional regulator with XRE-family HTH domain